MPPDSYVLLIDDCSQSRHDLNLILGFLGEDPLQTPFADWQKAREQVESAAAIKCVIVGQCDGAAGLEQLLAQLDKWDPHMPVVVLGRERTAELPEHLRPRILSALEQPVTYNQLLDTLHRAQVYREVFDEDQRKYQREANLFRSLVGSTLR